MKTLGLIGGTSWFSTVEYYKLINQMINKRLGGANAAQLILYSVNFQEFKQLMDASDWGTISSLLSAIAQKLETAGAGCIVLCANTPHLVAGDIKKHTSIPLIHIAEETGREIRRHNLRKVGLLGTRFVMEQPFYREALTTFGIEMIVPGKEARAFIHNSIYNELTSGIFTEETKRTYLAIIEELKKAGAQGVIFGCTEIPLLIEEEESPLQSFDTTQIHVTAAVNFALESYDKQR